MNPESERITPLHVFGAFLIAVTMWLALVAFLVMAS